jgi:hypothetical protein
MRTPYFGKAPQNADEAFLRRQVATDFIRQRGTSQVPNPPRDLIAQSAPRSVLITWGLPPGDASDISGWKIYSPDENTLIGRISDRGTRTYSVPATSGASPPTINIYVSSTNNLGSESVRVLIQGKAIAEGGAPAQPSAPPGFSSGPGSDTSSSVGNFSRPVPPSGGRGPS